MNKTVNINLAGLFFHIDESAYAKLQRYLDAIKRSFTDAQGREEIIQDIEARIAELFSERVKNERQVIGMAEVEEVINIMGQPEDYRLDEEIFEDEPTKKHNYTDSSTKKLYRDTEHSYIGGVCSGLGHYLQIDAVWLRIALILLTIFSWGGFILIYAAFWIFVPEARTTSEKLEMRGKPVNIDNIQRKVKEGFDTVADSVKNVDYVKYGNKAREGAGSFASTLGKIIMFILKVFVKFIGILLILIGGCTLIGLFVGLFTAGTLDFFDGSIADYVEMANTSGAPLWLITLLTFLAVGIPFFMLFYLGLRILVNTLKRLSLTAKLTLLGLWLVSLIAIAVLGVRQGMATAVDGEKLITEVLPVQSTDTLTVKMKTQNKYSAEKYHNQSWKIRTDDNGNKVIYNRDVNLSVQKSDSPETKLIIKKNAQGSSFNEAENRAQQIVYNFEVIGNTLLLDNFFVTDYINKFRDQEVELILAIPEGMALLTDNNISTYHRSRYSDLLDRDYIGYYTVMQDSELICTTCPIEVIEQEVEENNEWEYSESTSDSTVTNNVYEYQSKVEPEQDGVEVETPEKELDSIN
ncbi:PspC domain-containing protein [Leeuwenhoekiella marinoflava]|uniref:Phage shock protein C (PspC) family protein n=2 Tax=Leeuwenhoekiella marinoflava TaxID=988 RepID=A0A4Q0PLM1_9FLAO|nr:PspC domain-containing protein [Leeuwenhoekiella marinoflava]RXG28496.1 phage shock protein C (PspC) family protein [Leeuwenhoekiella marinoflava]SHF53140.1 phage shock protein C (PspC) family protein [Leeuwenhoekiella marinoflava DSM 3653]